MPRLIPVRRGGFTLMELMIAVALFGLVMATMMAVLTRQQRFYRGANEIIDARTQLRQAASVLPTDLRSVSSIGGDIKLATDTMVEFLATFGTAVLCNTVGSTQFVVAPDTLSRHTLTAWLMQPQVGDTAFVYDEAGLTGSEDDRWLRTGITGVTTQTTGCDTYLNPNGSEAGRTRYLFTLSTLTSLTPLATTVKPGAVVRFARPARYRFYRGGDGNWYLGYQQYTVSGMTGSWSTLQPLAGPYRPYVSGGTTNGLVFRYYTQSGALVTTPSAVPATLAAIARVDVTLRAIGGQVNNTALARGGQFRDSLLIRIAVRNRS